MNILSELKELLKETKIPIETGVFKDTAPNTYIVLVPLADTFPFNADDKPQIDHQECRITIFSKSNYLNLKRQITSLVLDSDFLVTSRTYNGYDAGTGYYQYSIDVAKCYDMEDK